MVLKKVSDSVSEIFGIEKSIGFVMEKNYQKNLGFVCLKHGFLKFGIGIGIGFETFPVFFGWYWIRGRKYLESEKSSDSVSFRFWVSSHTGSVL